MSGSQDMIEILVGERDRAIGKRRRRDGRREVYEWMEIIDHCGCWWTCCCCRGACGVERNEGSGDDRPESS